MRMGEVERDALAHLGEHVAAAARPQTAHLQNMIEHVARHECALAELDAELDRSLQNDRSDYATVSPWFRPLVIVRGVAARAVVRHRKRVLRQQRAASCERLGATALETSLHLGGPGRAFEEAARAARAEADCARARAAALVEPFGGTLVPRAAHHVAREARELAKAALKEVRAHVVPRVPALAALGAGWWVANTFTDSQLSATLHSLGIGSGPRHAVDSETYEKLSFWLPIGAAAICSYAGNRVAVLIQSRYSPGDGLPSQTANSHLDDPRATTR